MPRSTTPSRRHFAASFAALVALLVGLVAGSARAQPSSSLVITGLRFLAPRGLEIQARFLAYSINAPGVPTFTAQIEGREIAPTKTIHSNTDQRDYTLLFDLPVAPDGRFHAVRITVRDRPAPAPAFVSEASSVLLGTLPGTPGSTRPLPALDPLPSSEPSWIESLGWQGWVLLGALALGLARGLWSLIASTPKRAAAPAPSGPEEAHTQVDGGEAAKTAPKPEGRRKRRPKAPAGDGAETATAPSTTKQEEAAPAPPRPMRVFYSYARADEGFREELEKHLATLRRSGLIEEWHDRRIAPGEEWERAIDHYLETADFVLLLVSPDFISSDYCYEVEMKRALERHERGEARVIPVIVRPSDWTSTPFRTLEVLPEDALPISRWDDRDEAWLDVVRKLRRHLEDRQKGLSGASRGGAKARAS